MASPTKCIHPNCTKTNIFARNRCNAHYLIWRQARKDAGVWQPYMDTSDLDEATATGRQKWEYTNDAGEAELIAEAEKQERLERERSERKEPRIERIDSIRVVVARVKPS
jgi:hypothetical protein